MISLKQAFILYLVMFPYFAFCSNKEIYDKVKKAVETTIDKVTGDTKASSNLADSLSSFSSSMGNAIGSSIGNAVKNAAEGIKYTGIGIAFFSVFQGISSIYTAYNSDCYETSYLWGLYKLSNKKGCKEGK